MTPILLDQYGSPLSSKEDPRIAANFEVARLRRQISTLVRQRAGGTGLLARWDASQTSDDNANHWQFTDNLDPHSAAASSIRRILRIRSRYELMENNPYLKGCILTLGNDFIGGGPKLQIIEDAEGWSDDHRQLVERKFSHWWNACGMTSKLWRMRLAKLVDGETFAFAFTNDNRKLEHRSMPVKLDYYLVETDRVASPWGSNGMITGDNTRELDGLRWDKYDQPISYNLLPYHPGSTVFPGRTVTPNWVPADMVLHWFRQDRSWLRGIPEMAPSIPLCALLRRYTLAVVSAAEIAADFAGVIESDGPSVGNPWANAQDDPFDTFPAERGMILRLPWGYSLKQLEAKQPIQTYDIFVNSLLREILRPMCLPFNIGAGTSKESNMASAVVDSHIYRGSQYRERQHCNEANLDTAFCLWYAEARLIDGYLEVPEVPDTFFPKRDWGWDQVGLDHTDPQKVMEALKIASEKGFLTDRDIQRTYYNRDVEAWREEIAKDQKFREEHGLKEDPNQQPAFPGGNSDKPPAKMGSKTKPGMPSE